MYKKKSNSGNTVKFINYCKNIFALCFGSKMSFYVNGQFTLKNAHIAHV